MNISQEIIQAVDDCDLLVVGSGLFGLTVARQAADAGLSVVVIEKRDHVGGNAYSYFDKETGIEVHKYGSHLFHTSNVRVWDFAKRFTEFTNYRHHVFTKHNNQIFQMPINLGTITQFFRQAMTPKEARLLIETQSKSMSTKTDITNFEDKAISLIGEPLYEAFIKGYTRKQWDTDPRDLPGEIISRLPVRFNFDNRYFSDEFEGLPKQGYGAWFDAMLNHSNIQVFLEIDFFDLRKHVGAEKRIVYTGPLDKYFDFSQGRLNWRTLDFDFKIIDVEDFQGTSVMNYADETVAYTRVHEFKHLHPERKYPSKKTVIAYEYSRLSKQSDDPYYPVNAAADRNVLKKYRSIAKSEANVFFGGRLGSYQYLDMHMAIASGLSVWENDIRSHF